MGLAQFIVSGRSPIPFPKKDVGVIVLKVSAPTAFAPVLATDPTAPDKTSSCVVSVRNCHLNDVSRFWNPLALGRPGELSASRSTRQRRRMSQ